MLPHCGLDEPGEATTAISAGGWRRTAQASPRPGGQGLLQPKSMTTSWCVKACDGGDRPMSAGHQKWRDESSSSNRPLATMTMQKVRQANYSTQIRVHDS